MRIEIDTKHDSKEELRHLATMLHALAGSSSSISVSADDRFPDPRDDRIQRKLARRGIFDEPSARSPEPSGGLFNIFGNDAPQTPPASAAGDMFSLFSDPAPSAPPDPVSQSSSPLEMLTPMGASSSSVFSDGVATASDTGKSAQELLDDERIVPY